MQWSPQQQHALEAVREWYSNSDQQVFRLFGYAGTGKTTIANALAQECGGSYIFGAYTGKAALVLREKGAPGYTLHSLIYLPRDKCAARLLQMKHDLTDLQQTNADAQEIHELKRAIEEEEENLSRPDFTLNVKSKLLHVGLLVVDEVSMVGETMARDLISFGTKILVLGDPAQLPPVKEGGYFTEADPDVMLTEIHRQAEGSPIIEMATTVRQGGRLKLGSYGDCQVVPKGRIDVPALAEFDQILVGRNATRNTINRLYREQILGHADPLPQPGDRVVCLRNDREQETLLNGSLWHVVGTEVIDDNLVELELLNDSGDSDGSTIKSVAHRHYFEGRKLEYWEKKLAQEFDYGYALTVHKAQGSQWNNIMLVDESFCFRKDAARWLYTGITRAAERLTISR